MKPNTFFNGRRHSSIDTVAIENLAHQRRVSIEPNLLGLGGNTHLSVGSHSRRHSVLFPSNLSSRRRSTRVLSFQSLGSTTFTGLPLAPPPQTKMENTYKMRPDKDKQYKEFSIKKATEKIVDEVLEGTSYMKNERSLPMIQREIPENDTTEPSEGGRLAKILVNEIKDELKTLKMDRYKFVVNAVVSECRRQGFLMASRCLWDADSDGHVIVQRKTERHFLVVSVHAAYME